MDWDWWDETRMLVGASVNVMLESTAHTQQAGEMGTALDVRIRALPHNSTGSSCVAMEAQACNWQQHGSTCTRVVMMMCVVSGRGVRTDDECGCWGNGKGTPIGQQHSFTTAHHSSPPPPHTHTQMYAYTPDVPEAKVLALLGPLRMTGLVGVPATEKAEPRLRVAKVRSPTCTVSSVPFRGLVSAP